MTNRKGFLAVLLLSALLIGAMLFPGATYAESPTETKTGHLSVTGRGQMEVKPDTAMITLGITQLKPTPIEAYNAMSADLVNIAGQVKASGIAEDQIQTSTFSLNPEYNWTQDKGQVLMGYRATTTLSITTQELDKVASLIQSAMNAGANQLHGVSFFVKDTDKLAQQALDMAVDDAKAKAERVAGRMGAKVLRVANISISDNGVPIYRTAMDSGMAAEAKAAAAPAPVFGGTTSFSVTVQVTFVIE